MFADATPGRYRGLSFFRSFRALGRSGDLGLVAGSGRLVPFRNGTEGRGSPGYLGCYPGCDPGKTGLASRRASVTLALLGAFNAWFAFGASLRIRCMNVDYWDLPSFFCVRPAGTSNRLAGRFSYLASLIWLMKCGLPSL